MIFIIWSFSIEKNRVRKKIGSGLSSLHRYIYERKKGSGEEKGVRY